MITDRWRAATADFNPNNSLAEQCLQEIIAAYSSPGRHYHTLVHIEHLLRLSKKYQQELANKQVVDLAIFYHDIVYEVPGADNEHKSALLAAERLRGLSAPEFVVSEVCTFIEATKPHEPVETANFSDLCYFLDFDMSTLAADWDVYVAYIENIRKEYSFFPDEMYSPGRAGFLQQTLRKEHFFHTAAFRALEPKARENMERELNLYI